MNRMSASDRTHLLQRLVTAHDLTAEDIAVVTGASAETCRRWLRGSPSIPKRRLAELIETMRDMAALSEAPGLYDRINASVGKGQTVAYDPSARLVGAWDRREAVPAGFTALRIRPRAIVN